VNSHHQKPNQPKLTLNQMDLLESSIVLLNVELVKKNQTTVSLVTARELQLLIATAKMDTMKMKMVSVSCVTINALLV
jgi:hypothetical protein